MARAKLKKGFGLLDAATRTEIEDILIEIDTEMLQDFKGGDMVDIAADGWKGIKSYTDNDLVDYLNDVYQLDDEESFEEGDSTVLLYRKARSELEMAKYLKSKPGGKRRVSS